MTELKPCPFCGGDSEYLRFLDLCAEHANKIWRENEVKILTDVYKSMDFIQVVRCRDCKHWQPWRKGAEPECWANGEPFSTPPDGYCAWGERRKDEQMRQG